ncbi:hypothetical protein HDU76_013872 [Blyttiomyces sp. JEL0837]|nr:hypothetical protein HDU76_013872 [Blyttiomyces sp. JEL0837]
MLVMDTNVTRLQDLEGIVLSRQVMLWLVNMINKGLFVGPRLIAMYEKGTQVDGDGGINSDQIGITSVLQKAAKGVFYARKNDVNDSFLKPVQLMTAAKESRGVPHKVLGGAIASFKHPHQNVFWSQWSQTGVTIFFKFHKCWVVFDYDKGSISSILTNKETMTIKNEYKAIHQFTNFACLFGIR